MDNANNLNCLVIDPSNLTVQPHPAPLTLEMLYELVGCSELEAAMLENGDMLMFDAEPVPYHTTLDVFILDGITVPGSRAVIVGHDDETHVHGCRSDLRTISNAIVWRPRRRITGESHSTVLTPFGSAFQVGYVYEPAL